MTELDINKLFISVHTSASCWYCRREVYVVMNLRAHFFYHTYRFPLQCFYRSGPTHRHQNFIRPLSFFHQRFELLAATFFLFSSFNISVKTGQCLSLVQPHYCYGWLVACEFQAFQTEQEALDVYSRSLTKGKQWGRDEAARQRRKV